jgi:glycosyltransferase involved in cell wall biosynthesis
MSVLLIDALSARRGGGQTYLRNLLTRLPPGEPAQIYVLAQPELEAELSRDRVRVVQPRWPMHNGLLLSIWKKLFLRRYAEKLGASLVFFPGGIVGASVPAGARSATMFRNVIPFDRAQRRRYGLSYQWLRNWLLERVMLKGMLGADRVIFLSDYGRSLIEKRAGHAIAGAVTIPHGVSDAFRSAGPRPTWLPGNPYVLYVSTFEPYKAQVEVVQAFARVVREWKEPLSLVLLGYQRTAYGARVQQEIATRGLTERVLLPGNRPYAELPAANHHALITVFASEAENCPNVLLEAMASGKAILCSSRPPMPEFGGDAVLYFDPSNADELATRLLRLLHEPDARAALGARAAERSRRYDWDETARKTWAALLDGIK